MRTRQQLARESASGLITALCLLYAQKAIATDDPFSLPVNVLQPTNTNNITGAEIDATHRSSTTKYKLFAEIRVNGVPGKRLVQLLDVDGQISILAKDAEAAGLTQRVSFDAYLKLESLKLLQWNFDRISGILSVDVARKSDGPNDVNLARGREYSIDGQPLTAFIANYNVTTAISRNGLSAAGILESRLVRGNVALASSVRFATNNPSSHPAVVRLESGITLNLPNDATSVTLGDFITAGPTSARAIRLGGLRIGTNFGLRPDLITYPLPDFTGFVAVPTGLDLVIADRRFKAAQVEAGEFTVRNIPVPVGRNSVGVVVRDFLGQERIDTVEFYTSRSLLASGLSQYSVNVGAIRRNFGRLSSDYGRWAATAYFRHGITNKLTIDPTIEIANGYSNLGLSSTFTLGSFALLTLEARASRLSCELSNPALVIGRRGNLIGASFESIGRRLSFRFEARKVSKNFDDISSVSGDRPPPTFISSSLNFDLEDLGNFRLTAIRQTQQRRAVGLGEVSRSDIVTASYRKSFTSGINVFVDATHQRAERNSNSLLIGLSLQFGKRTNGQANISRQGGRIQANAGLYRLDTSSGEAGYAITAGTGSIDQGSALLAYRDEWGRVEAQTEFVGKEWAARIGAAGSLLYADGHVFGSRRLDNGFALVRTGKVANVSIEQESRPAGKTNRAGYKLLAEFPAYVPTRVSIEPKSLPDMAVVRKLSAMIVVPSGSGTLVDLDVENYQPGLFRLLQSNGQTVPPGTVVKAMPSKSEYVVGFNGTIEVNSWHNDNELRFAGEDGGTCFASFTASSLNGLNNSSEDIPEIRCNGSIRTMALGK